MTSALRFRLFREDLDLARDEYLVIGALLSV